MEKKENDDEISIDLSKFKSWFKGKKESTETPVQTTAAKDETQSHSEQKAEHKPKDHHAESQKKENANKEHHHEHKKTHHEHSKERREDSQTKDDEIAIDFSKIKNLFKIEKEKREISKSESGDDIAIDLGKIREFGSKYSVVLLLLIPIFLAIFLRTLPATLPITDEWAENSVYNSIKSQIQAQIDQQYPNLPDANKQTLVENEFQKIKKERKAELDQQVKATSDFFKSKLKDDSGTTYLIGIDPEFWARHARNIINNGHPGDTLVDGKPWDNHMLAPLGRFVPYDMFHSYVIAYTYKFLDLFGEPNFLKVVFYNPVWLCALIVIPAFFIARKIAGNFGGLIAGIIVAIHPAFLTRTTGGFSDNDPYNLLFPLLITWMYIEALDSKKFRSAAIFSALGGLFVGVYGLAWSGWWYIFDFILAASACYLVYYGWMHRRELKNSLAAFSRQVPVRNSIAFLGIFVTVSAMSMSVFIDFNEFSHFMSGPLSFTQLKEIGIRNVWPNVYTTVAEQNPASVSSVVSQTGLGKPIFFFIGAFGISLTMLGSGLVSRYFLIGSAAWYTLLFFMKVQTLMPLLILLSIPILIRIIIALLQDDTEIELKYTFLLIFWLLATTYAGVKGVRYTMLAIPPFAIGFAFACNTLFSYVSSTITKNLNVNRLISKSAIAILILVLIGMLPIPWPPFCMGAICNSAYEIGKNEIPNFSDEWRISLERIRDDSTMDNGIITSWWDFGHWFKYWADRPVTFDGTTQNTAQAHWVGLSLLTENEKLAGAMIRMLDCGERGGFYLIVKKTQDQKEAVDITKRILEMNKKDAKKFLLEKYTPEEADAILAKTHCDNPPNAYFITSEDMIGKSGVWGHFGAWDFERSLIYITLKGEEYLNNKEKSVQFLQDRLNYSKEQAEQMYFEVQGVITNDQANNWIAPWPGYAGEVGCSRSENTLTCSNGFVVDLTTFETTAQTQQGVMHPKKISIPINGSLIVKEYNESILTIGNGRDLGLALIPNGNSYSMVQMDSDQSASMFTRMFFQEGAGLEYFKKFSDERTIFGGRVIVWKMDWQAYLDDVEA